MPPGSFRLFLASLVVVHHFSRLSLGDAAVLLFFTLSGYWIVRMWSERYSRARLSYATFVVSRFWRLVPTFLLCNLVAFVLLRQAPPTGLAEWVPNLVILGYKSLPHPALVPAWSLDIELQFYLVAPLLCLLLAWRGSLGSMAVLAVALAGFAWFLLQGGGAKASNLLQLGLFFVLGMLVARWSWTPSRAVALGSAAAALGVIAAVMALPFARGALLGGANPGPAFIYNGVLNAAIALIAVPFAASTLHRTTRHRFLDRAAGDISYIVYLLHWPAVVLVTSVYGSLSPSARLPYVALAIVAVYVAAALILFAFDRPIGRWREGFVARRIGAPDVIHSSSTTPPQPRLT